MCPPFRASWHNGHQAVHHVSSSLSKIPYGGFSPVRLQAESRWPPSPLRAYRPPKALAVLASGSPKGNRRSVSASLRGPSRRIGPEALGSAKEGLHLPTGCSVPSRHRLLWPHPSFWPASGGLGFFVRRTLGEPEGPCFKLRILLVVPLPVPRRTGRPEDDCTSARDSLRPNATGSASAVVPLESVHVGCPFEAAEFA